ncbi:MAG TPA: hypothetical protein VE242_07525 [Chthoniobacterales bacterium]|nr:hypothetical protein [Chthoniobacterales bacterium]
MRGLLFSNDFKKLTIPGFSFSAQALERAIDRVCGGLKGQVNFLLAQDSSAKLHSEPNKAIYEHRLLDALQELGFLAREGQAPFCPPILDRR